MIGHTIARLILVPIGLLVGALAALFVLVTLGQERVVAALSTASSDTAVLDLGAVLLKLSLVMLSPQVLLLPVLVAIGGEVARIRNAIYYVAAGGLAFALVPLMARLGGPGPLADTAAIWPIFATAGFAGGFVYWLLAGRRAG